VSDNVVPIPTRLTADAAWSRYRREAQRLLDDPGLLIDRRFREQLLLAEMAWRETFERTLRVN
jgi:hypothetical protein